MDEIIKHFQEDKFNEIIEMSNKINISTELLNKKKEEVLEFFSHDVKKNNININNVLNRLYLINTKMETLHDDINILLNDKDSLLNTSLDEEVRFLVKDEKYSNYILKPFLPYILISSLINMDKFGEIE